MNYHKKMLTCMLTEARGDLKATVGNKLKPGYRFIRIIFVLFCFFQPESCVPWQAGQSQADV